MNPPDPKDLPIPAWLEAAEKYIDAAPKDGREYRAVVVNGVTWYTPLTIVEAVDRAKDEAAAFIKEDNEARAAWAEHDAWDTLTIEQKLDKLRPRPPKVPRPAGEPNV